MAAPSLTYTLTNGSTADASQVMQDLNDLLNGITDGTKDLSISALTCAGTATLNGHVNLGNASADDLTITASLASSIAVKTTNTYNIGDSTHGLASIYFGANSQTVRILPSASMSATWTLTLPTTAGTDNMHLITNGSGTTAWSSGSELGRVRVDTSNGYGSTTGTKIRRWTNVPINTGTGITYADSATAGGSFTITVDGIYAMSYTEDFNAGGHFGISLNATGTTSVTNLSVSARLCSGLTGGNDQEQTCAIVMRLAANDVIRCHTNADAAGASNDRTQFTITRIM